MKAKTDKPRGLLNPHTGKKRFQLIRYVPSEGLRGFVEHYWIVRWDLRGQAPYVSENLPYPSVHLVVEQGKSGIFGVVTGKFTRCLEGEGLVFAVKFRPGAFYPLVKTPVSQFTDIVIPLRDAFGEEGEILEVAILADEDTFGRIELAEDFLLQRLSERDEAIEHINHIFDFIIRHPTITRVDDVAERCNLSTRTLQRLFNQYVEVSPKWVIKRYRLHEAAEQLAGGAVADWTKLALELGYFDQAHFIKDFRTIIGCTPADYVRQSYGRA